jgi:hypothetical protein
MMNIFIHDESRVEKFAEFIFGELKKMKKNEESLNQT